MKIKAVITGPVVQGVGYRVFLMHQAILEGIERFTALNVSDDTVVVLAEADDEKISSLKEFLLTRRPEHAQVSEVRIEEFDGRVMTLQEATILNTADQMNKTIPILVSMDGKLDRIDKTTERMEGKLEMIGETQEEDVNQVRGLREDLGTIHAERMERMERDIAEIRQMCSFSSLNALRSERRPQIRISRNLDFVSSIPEGELPCIHRPLPKGPSFLD